MAWSTPPEQQDETSVAPPGTPGHAPTPAPSASARKGAFRTAGDLLQGEWQVLLLPAAVAAVLVYALWELAQALGLGRVLTDDESFGSWLAVTSALAVGFATVCTLGAPVFRAARAGQRAGYEAMFDHLGRSLRDAVPLLGFTVAAITIPFALWGWADLVAWGDVVHGGDQGWWILSYALAFLAAIPLTVWAFGRLLLLGGLVATGRDDELDPLAEARALVRKNRLWFSGHALAIFVITLVISSLWLLPIGTLLSVADASPVTDLFGVVLAAPLLLWPVTAAVGLANALRARQTAGPQPGARWLNGASATALVLLCGGFVLHVALKDWTVDKSPLRKLEADPMASYSPPAAAATHRGEHQDQVVHNLTLGFGDEAPDLNAYTRQQVEFPETTSADELSGHLQATVAAAQQAGWTVRSDEPRQGPDSESGSLGYWSGTKTIGGMPATIEITTSPSGRDYYERDVLQYHQKPTVDIAIDSAISD